MKTLTAKVKYENFNIRKGFSLDHFCATQGKYYSRQRCGQSVGSVMTQRVADNAIRDAGHSASSQKMPVFGRSKTLTHLLTCPLTLHGAQSFLRS